MKYTSFITFINTKTEKDFVSNGHLLNVLLRQFSSFSPFTAAAFFSVFYVEVTRVEMYVEDANHVSSFLSISYLRLAAG